MKQDTYNGMKLVNVNVDYMQVFVIVNNAGMKINADVNINNWVTKEYVIKDFFGILVISNVNVTNHAILENT